MKNDLFINDEDVFTTCGVAMGENFLQELLKPGALKELVQNADRSKHGKQVIYDSEPRLETRDVTLQFNIEGETPEEYMAHFSHFTALLRKGEVRLSVPGVSGDIYHLTYLNAANFALSANRNFSTLAVKFNEPNPANRA